MASKQARRRDEIVALELDQVLKRIKKPRYLLGTTYTISLAFFESIVLPALDRTQLKKSVILCDGFGFSRAIDEAPALEGAGQDYIIAPVSAARCLHAKV